MQAKISVIVPVYNAEKMLPYAVESLLAQTMKEIEIILVDDCSSDESRKLISVYVEKDSRVKGIFLEQNAGPGAARNCGLDQASGEYITFVDSDDYIEKDMYEEMYREAKASRADICVCGYMQDILGADRKHKESIAVVPSDRKAMDEKEVCECAVKLDKEKNFAYIWNKLYKRDILNNEAKVRFNKQSFGEDFIFNVEAFSNAEVVFVMGKAYYHYLEFNTDSLCQKVIPDFYSIICARHHKIKDLCEKRGCFDGQVRAEIYATHIKHIMASFVRNCDPRMNLSFNERRYRIKQTFSDQEIPDICKYARAEEKSQKILNLVFRTRSPVICQMFTELAWIAKKYCSPIFNHLK